MVEWLFNWFNSSGTESDELGHAALSRGELFSSTSGACVLRDAHLALRPGTTISPQLSPSYHANVSSAAPAGRDETWVLNINHVITFEEVICANRCFFLFVVLFFSSDDKREH